MEIISNSVNEKSTNKFLQCPATFPKTRAFRFVLFSPVPQPQITAFLHRLLADQISRKDEIKTLKIVRFSRPAPSFPTSIWWKAAHKQRLVTIRFVATPRSLRVIIHLSTRRISLLNSPSWIILKATNIHHEILNLLSLTSWDSVNLFELTSH